MQNYGAGEGAGAAEKGASVSYVNDERGGGAAGSLAHLPGRVGGLTVNSVIPKNRSRKNVLKYPTRRC